MPNCKLKCLECNYSEQKLSGLKPFSLCSIKLRNFFWDTRYWICYVAKYSIAYGKTIIEPFNCYVILPRTLSLMVKLSLGSQGIRLKKSCSLNIKAMMFINLPGFNRSFLPVEIGDFLQKAPFETCKKE